MNLQTIGKPARKPRFSAARTYGRINEKREISATFPGSFLENRALRLSDLAPGLQTAKAIPAEWRRHRRVAPGGAQVARCRRHSPTPYSQTGAS